MINTMLSCFQWGTINPNKKNTIYTIYTIVNSVNSVSK